MWMEGLWSGDISKNVKNESPFEWNKQEGVLKQQDSTTDRHSYED